MLLLWQHCRFQPLLKDFKECSAITSSHMIFKDLCYQLVLDMNANGKSTQRLTNRRASVRRALVEVGRGSSSIYPTYPRLNLNHPRLS